MSRSTGAGSRARGAAGNGRAMPALAPAGGRQRRWSLALVAVLVTLGSALAFAVLWLNAGDRKPVLAVTRNVPAGQVIASQDIEVVRVSADPALTPVPSDRRGEIIGQTASFDLVAGTLLTEGAVGEATALEVGTAVVAVALGAGELPTASLREGDRVLTVLTGIEGEAVEDGGPAPDVLGRVIGRGATVYALERDEVDGSLIVSLMVGEPDAAAVAGAEAADRISLVLVPTP